jgi:nucleoside-diphosphate-sugar epimerase
VRVFVAGATGAIGRYLVPQLRSAGHEPIATTRSEERASRLRESGVEAVTCDALDRAALVRAVSEARPDAVVHELTAIPHQLNPRNIDREFELTNRLRTEGTRNLIEAAREAGAGRFVAQSVAFIYEPEGDWVKSEDDPTYARAPKGFTETAAAVQELERLVSDAGGTVLRYGLFYGPGTTYASGGALAELVRARRFPVVGAGEARLSFIHLEDAARATVAAVEAGKPGVFNVVDDEPAVAGEWLREYARLLGAKPPRKVPAWLARLAAGQYGVVMMTQMRGASNQKAKAELDWEPTRRTWREGFRAEIAGRAA